MAGFIGDGSVVDYVNTTSGEAQGVRALNGVGGLHVRVRYNGLPPSVDHIITETTSEIISTESSEEFITETS